MSKSWDGVEWKKNFNCPVPLNLEFLAPLHLILQFIAPPQPQIANLFLLCPAKDFVWNSSKNMKLSTPGMSTFKPYSLSDKLGVITVKSDAIDHILKRQK